VDCQVGHRVVADMEERTLSLLDGHDPAELGIKVIMGLLSGISLHGDEVIEATWCQGQPAACAFGGLPAAIHALGHGLPRQP
jgi:hypothetical protein